METLYAPFKALKAAKPWAFLPMFDFYGRDGLRLRPAVASQWLDFGGHVRPVPFFSM
jgi:hypothetical protein